jgi:hypothetical protein
MIFIFFQSSLSKHNQKFNEENKNLSNLLSYVIYDSTVIECYNYEDSANN